jgi:hypothetical protein
MVNRLSRKVYTVDMVSHDRPPCVMNPDSPSTGLPAYADLGLAAHLAKESASVYTTDYVRFSSK